MDLESILGVMGISTKVNGKLVFVTVKDPILSLLATHMLESTPGAKLKAMASMFGGMETHTLVSFIMARKMDKVTGRRVEILIQTSTVENTKMTKNMDMVSSHGIREVSTKETMLTT